MVVTDNEPPLIFDKDDANERQKSSLLFARVQLIFDKDKKRAAQRQMNAEVFSEHGMNRISYKYVTKMESTDTKPSGLKERKSNRTCDSHDVKYGKAKRERQRSALLLRHSATPPCNTF